MPEYIRATKTSMYKLAERYFPELPKMKQTDFFKVPRAHSYFLTCYDHGIYLTAVMGNALLSDKHGQQWHIPIDELRELGMIAEY